jgi:hypothetical protein
MQDRICQVDETLLQRTAGPYIGSFSEVGLRNREVRFSPFSDQIADIA